MYFLKIREFAIKIIKYKPMSKFGKPVCQVKIPFYIPITSIVH